MHLASQAAVAIENARLFEASTRWSRQLESLIEVGNALATETDVARLLDLVATRLRDLIEARLRHGALAARPGRAPLRRRGRRGRRGARRRAAADRDASKSGRVFERRRSERVDSVIDDPEVSREVTRRLAARSGLWVPLVVRDRAIGVIAAYDKVGD